MIADEGFGVIESFFQRGERVLVADITEYHGRVAE